MLKLNFEVESEGNLGWVKDGRGLYGEFAGLVRKGGDKSCWLLGGDGVNYR